MIDPAHPDYSDTPASASRAVFGYLPADPDTNPCVSIVTPFYNSGEVFHETATSVMRQSLQQWEWIIVNDGSNDPSSGEILERYRNGDPRVRVIDHPENRGLPAARNTGFKEARAEYVAVLDSDDLLEPTTLEKWAWFLESHPECAFVTGYSVGFGAAQYLWPGGFHSGREFLRRNMVNATTAVRKSVHGAVGGYREDMRGGLEDWEFWLRCADRGFWGDTIPEHLDWYRRRTDHSDRWENLDAKGKQDSACRQIQAAYAHLERCFPTLKREPLEIYPQVPDTTPFENRLQKSKTRLLMLIPWMTIGGADKFNLDLVSQLTGRNWEVTVVATLAGDNCWYPQFARKTPDIFILDHFLTLTDWPRFICYLIRSRRVDHVLISNSDFGYSVLPYLKLQFPNVVFTDYCHMEEEYWKGGGYARRAVESQPLLDMNIVASEHLKDWMVQRGAESERVQVCYINIDSAEWLPRPENRAAIRKELDIGSGVPILFYAGRIHAQKQPKVFAETMLRLRDAGLSFAALVAGDGPEFQWLQHHVVEYRLQSYVRLLGALPNSQIRRILQASDIFFLPSRMEGISLVIYEAMACGIAVVGADVGGQKELVTPECGCLVPRDSESVEAEAYAAIISHLLRDPAKLRAMGEAGRSRIVNGFDLQVMGRRMQELFQLAADWNKNRARLPVNPGLGNSLLGTAIDYHRIEKLLRDVWPFYRWTQRNRSHLEILFVADKVPPPLGGRSVESPPHHPAEDGSLSSLKLLEESIYNLFAHLPERVLQSYLDPGISTRSQLLEDLLTMRRRILPEIDRWQQQKRRVAIYGIGTHTQVLLGSLPAVMPLVQFFIDRRASGSYLGKPCLRPEAVGPGDADVVIYSSKRWEAEMHRNLVHLTSVEHVLIYHSTSGQPAARA